MKKYAGIIYNDFAAGPGVCLTFFTQGCPHRCPECHNPEAWEFDGGLEFNNKVLERVLNGISKNGIIRDFAIQGGEPLCPENIPLTHLLVTEVRKKYPNIKIYIWTGYVYEDFLGNENPQLQEIFQKINYLIDGPYIKELRTLTTPMMGSTNQRVIRLN